MKNSIDDVLSFWFVETSPVQWFQISPDFDGLVKERFLDLFHFAEQGFCDAWAKNADGALALTILFDQFPRNMFRDTPDAYRTDSRALEIAELAIERGFDQILVPLKRLFLYLPFEHSENIDHQKRSVALCAQMKYDDPLRYEYALRHMKVIERFGRFPHRNKILGRDSTPEEIDYLKEFGGF
jgi:uncharacterized protein (DUF924 family)